MHLALGADYVDPDTQAPLPNAILVIVDADFKMRGGSTVLQTAVYASPAAYAAARSPISEHPIALTPAEIAAQMPALIYACLAVLAARTEFAGTTVVIPP